MGDTKSDQAVESLPLRTLEAALKARIGWCDRTVSPFALAARKRAKRFSARRRGKRSAGDMRFAG